MKRFALALVVMGLGVSACASVQQPRAMARPEVRAAMANVTVNQVYYDGHYGRLVSGFWGPDGYFYYSTSGPAHRRDGARHVRRQQIAGFDRVRVPDLMHIAGIERRPARRG